MPPAYDDAKVHLDVLGQVREIQCKVRVGPTRLLELLPLARSLSAELVSIAAEHARGEGKEVSCRKGCTHCCRQLVPLSPLEAKRIADIVEGMPKKRRNAIRERFVRLIEPLEREGLLDPKAPAGRRALQSRETSASAAWDDVSRRYYELRLDCPFLENDLCSIYDERPLACREYNAVTDPALCEAFDPNIEALPRPLPMGEVLTKVASEITGEDFQGIPLALALEWARSHGKALEKSGEGEEMFWVLMGVMEESSR
jgi:Fe-S-cluster containining protein